MSNENSGAPGQARVTEMSASAQLRTLLAQRRWRHSVAPRGAAGYQHRMQATPPPLDDATKNDGDFYVEPDCCRLCGVPEDIAPQIFHTGEQHCSIIRQPSSRDEIDQTIRAMWSSEVDCVRYRGRDETMLERLARAGMAGQADHGNTSASLIHLRDQVSFDMPAGAGLMDASQVANAFREDMRTKGKKVLPALLGKRSVWLSWYQNRFHLVRFADAGRGQFVARLRWTMAVQGLAWLVDDWLRAQSVENIRWEATNDPSSSSVTPM